MQNKILLISILTFGAIYTNPFAEHISDGKFSESAELEIKNVLKELNITVCPEIRKTSSRFFEIYPGQINGLFIKDYNYLFINKEKFEKLDFEEKKFVLGWWFFGIEFLVTRQTKLNHISLAYLLSIMGAEIWAIYNLAKLPKEPKNIKYFLAFFGAIGISVYTFFKINKSFSENTLLVGDEFIISKTNSLEGAISYLNKIKEINPKTPMINERIKNLENKKQTTK